jgi:hypothetical protein
MQVCTHTPPVLLHQDVGLIHRINWMKWLRNTTAHVQQDLQLIAVPRLFFALQHSHCQH